MSLNISAANIRWLERDYDFGLFKEIGGPKTGTSRFINLGPDTIAVIGVRPSCGCTSADYSKSPIAPGDTAVISYTYDPTMRPGRFEKSVTVRLSDGSRHNIAISGNVLGTPESLDQLFPIAAGDLRFNERIIPFGEVLRGRRPVKFVGAYVLSPDSVIPQLISDNEALEIIPSVEKAGPGDVVTFTITLDAKRMQSYGPVEIKARSGEATFEISAVILPDPTELKLKQQSKSPVAEIRPDLIQISGTDGSARTASFTITNTGKAPLSLLSIYAGSQSVTVEKYPTTLKVGKSADIHLTINSEALSDSPVRVPVTVITDDPLRTRQTVQLVLTR